jgi:glutamine cyclotransferase
LHINGDPNSPNYWRHFFQTVDITLNGVAVSHVVEADDVAGYITQEIWDDVGPIIGTKRSVLRETTHGRVRIAGELLPQIH